MNVYYDKETLQIVKGSRSPRERYVKIFDNYGGGKWGNGRPTFAVYRGEDGQVHVFTANEGSTRQQRIAVAIRDLQDRFGMVNEAMLRNLQKNLPARNAKNRVTLYARIFNALKKRGMTDEECERWNDRVEMTD
jgi:hypothetical protein